MFDRDEDDDDIVISFKENNEANQSKKNNLKNRLIGHVPTKVDIEKQHNLIVHGQ